MHLHNSNERGGAFKKEKVSERKNGDFRLWRSNFIKNGSFDQRHQREAKAFDSWDSWIKLWSNCFTFKAHGVKFLLNMFAG